MRQASLKIANVGAHFRQRANIARQRLGVAKSILIFAFALRAAAQPALCTLYYQTAPGCAAICPDCGTANPTLGTFMGYTEASFNHLISADDHQPQPKILMTAQLIPASGAWQASNIPYYNGYVTKYSGLLKDGAGVGTQDINVWPAVFVSSPTYPARAAGRTVVASDCYQGQYLSFGDPIPTGTSPSSRCAALYGIDQEVAFSPGAHITLRWGVFPSGNTVSQVYPVGPGSPASACAVTDSPITEADVENCVLPMMQAMLDRYGSAVSRIQVLEEPTGGMRASNINLDVADTATYIVNMSAAAKSALPGVLVGAAATNSDGAYWFNWMGCTSDDPTTCGSCGGGTACAALDYGVLDIFTGSCNVASSSYAQVLINYQVGFLPDAVAAGKEVDVGQSDAPIWCQVGSSPSQATALLGQSDAIWYTSQLTSAWISTFTRWAASYGISSVAMFVNQPLFCISTDQAEDNALPGLPFAPVCMQTLTPNQNAATYLRMATLGPADIMQGYITLSGNVGITP